MKKRIYILALALLFFVTSTIAGTKAKAEGNNFSVKVSVLGYNDYIVKEDTSTQTNALSALDEVLKKRGVSYSAPDSKYGGKYISEINGLSEKHFNSNDGWMYTINRNGTYIDVYDSIDACKLQNGDKLILYFSDWSTTYLLNKLKFSTKKENQSLQIQLLYSAYDGDKPINGLGKVLLDDKEYTVQGNTITVPQGLSWGTHRLSINGFRSDSNAIALTDEIQFEFYPQAHIRIESLSNTIISGDVKGKNVLEMVQTLLNQNGHTSAVASSQYGEELVSVDGLKKGALGGYDGWMYYIKTNDKVVSPSEGMASYVPQDGENIVVYYGDWNVPYVNILKADPEVVGDKQPFKLRFTYMDFTGKVNPIVNSIVNIKSSKYSSNFVTDANGEINIPGGLEKGQYSYRIWGYNVTRLPNVVTDEGTFVIDGINPVGFNLSEERTGGSNDNSNIVKDINAEISAIKSYLSKNSDDPWTAVTLQKFGLQAGDSFIKEKADYILKNGISDVSNTDLEKLIFNLTSAGFTPYNFSGKDLVSELYSRPEEDILINDAVFGLLVYNYANINGDYSLTREKLINLILKSKLSYAEAGRQITGWSLAGDKINPDITGAVLSALAPYNDESHPQVKDAVSKAVESLSLIQDDGGYLKDNFGAFSESLSFTIIGLAAVGVNPEGDEFKKTNGDLVSALISYKGSEGQYKHSLDGTNNYMATEQALRAFYTLQQFKSSGKFDFYKSNIDAKALKVYDYTPQISSSNVEKYLFDAIKGTDKTLTFKETANGLEITWSFYGKDINFESKDIDLSLNEVPQFKDQIMTKVNNYDVKILSFKNNGILPGKTKLKVKLDEAWLNGKDRTNLYLYYYNDKTDKNEKIAGPLKVDDNNYVEFEITHCSDYFLLDKELPASGVLPATGSPIDSEVLIIIGVVSLLGGAFLVFRNKSYNN